MALKVFSNLNYESTSMYLNKYPGFAQKRLLWRSRAQALHCMVALHYCRMHYHKRDFSVFRGQLKTQQVAKKPWRFYFSTFLKPAIHDQGQEPVSEAHSSRAGGRAAHQIQQTHDHSSKNTPCYHCRPGIAQEGGMDRAFLTGFSLFYLFTPPKGCNFERLTQWEEAVLGSNHHPHRAVPGEWQSLGNNHGASSTRWACCSQDQHWDSLLGHHRHVHVALGDKI